MTHDTNARGIEREARESEGPSPKGEEPGRREPTRPSEVGAVLEPLPADEREAPSDGIVCPPIPQATKIEPKHGRNFVGFVHAYTEEQLVEYGRMCFVWGRECARADRASRAASPSGAAEERLQGGLTNDELREEWARKLPGVEPTDRDLTAFALGVEVGDRGSRTYFNERNSARDAWMRRVKQCEQLEAEVERLRAALAAAPAPQPGTLLIKRAEWQALSPEAQKKLEQITGAEHPDTRRARAEAAEALRSVPLGEAAPQPAALTDELAERIKAIKPAAPEALAMQTEQAQEFYRLGFQHAKELAAGVARAILSAGASPAAPALGASASPSGLLSADDVFTLIGHAEVLRLDGQTDMPAYVYDLARRIAISIGDEATAAHCVELAARGMEVRSIETAGLDGEAATARSAQADAPKNEAPDAQDAARWRAIVANERARLRLLTVFEPVAPWEDSRAALEAAIDAATTGAPAQPDGEPT